MSTTYQNSPFGIAQPVPWLNKADTKYNDDGVFKVKLAIGGPEALAFKEQTDEAAAAALANYFETHADGKKLKPGERKAWKVYVPYAEEKDDTTGEPTGYIVFTFKQNQKLKLKDGSIKVIKIAVMDSTGKKEVTRPVFTGSELRVQFSFRDIVMKSDKEVGVQLAFGRVQVKKLAESGAGGGGGFDAVDDGYVEEGGGGDTGSREGDNSTSHTNTTTDGDY